MAKSSTTPACPDMYKPYEKIANTLKKLDHAGCPEGIISVDYFLNEMKIHIRGNSFINQFKDNTGWRQLRVSPTVFGISLYKRNIFSKSDCTVSVMCVLEREEVVEMAKGDPYKMDPAFLAEASTITIMEKIWRFGS